MYNQNKDNKKMKFLHKMKPPSRPICQYSETEIHKYFVSNDAELYLGYECSSKSEMVCMIKEKMCYLCIIHYKRLIQWQQETSPDLDLKCNSVWDLQVCPKLLH